MFDSSAQIKIDARTAGGKRTLLVRWPTDQEWEDRALGRKILIKRLGRGVSETTIDSVEADARLYAGITLNGSPPLTPAEANRVVEAMATCEVSGVEIEGEEADVEMTVMGGVVHHHLRIPSAEQVLKLNKATRVLNMPYSQQQLRIGISAGAAVWDAVGGRSDDYTGSVPAIHKDTAVRAVIEWIDREISAGSDERNF